MPKIIHINPETTQYRGVTIYRNKDWNIHAVVISRNALRHNIVYSNLGINENTIYFLIGEDENYNLTVYVGRALERNLGESVIARTIEHTNSTKESYRDTWDTLITFKFDNITADEIRYLENYFYKHIDNSILKNTNTPDSGRYTTQDIKDKVVYIESYVKEIVKQNIFIEDKELYDNVIVKQSVQINYSDNEKISEGRRLVSKDKEKITEIHTPNEVVNKILDELPKSVWGPNTKFIDLACKNGEFLKEIMNRLLESPLYAGTKYENYVRRINHIMGEQIYGIALTDVSLQNTIDNLGTSRKTCNIIQLDNYKSRISKSKNSVIHEIRERLGLDNDMTINVVIGNPPYQDNTKTIYNDFINTAIEMNVDYISMIVKNNWLKSNTLKSTRDNMIRAGLKSITNYPIIGDVFNKESVQVAVSIFSIDKNYKGETHLKEVQGIKIDKDTRQTIENIVSEYNDKLSESDVIITNYTEKIIIDKFKKFTTEKDNFGRHTYATECFGITSNGNVGRGDSAYALNDYTDKDEEHDIAVIYMDQSRQPYVRYIKYDDIPRNSQLATKYKVIAAANFKSDDIVLRNIRAANPMTVCSKSWGVYFDTDSQEEALSVAKYLKTKTVRFLIGQLAEDNIIGMSPYRFSLVPDQDFTSASDIDWTKTVSEIDKQLYKKYNISDNEIEYIEKSIKEIKD